MEEYKENFIILTTTTILLGRYFCIFSDLLIHYLLNSKEAPELYFALQFKIIMTDLLNAYNDMNTDHVKCSILIYLFIFAFFTSFPSSVLKSSPIMRPFSYCTSTALFKVIKDLNVHKSNGQFSVFTSLDFKAALIMWIARSS